MANNLAVSSYTIGGDYNTWGTKFVADMAIINKFAGDTFLTSATSGTVTMSVVDAQNFSIKADGAGSTQVDIRVPDAIARYWYVRNDRVSGQITVRCAAGGSAVTIDPGQRRMIHSDGTNCVDLTLATLTSMVNAILNNTTTFYSSDAGAGAAPVLSIVRDRASEGGTRIIGRIEFIGNQGAPVPPHTPATYAYMYAKAITSGVESGQLYFGSGADVIFIDSSGLNLLAGKVLALDGGATLSGAANKIAKVTGSLSRNVPVTKTANFAVADAENWLIVDKASSCTVTLPNPANYSGREIMIKTIQAQTVVSASANVVPLVGGVAGTAILAATAGKWATLVSDGTNWIIMQAN